ncbi:MAG: TonB-dependent receptor, partial [Gammaproteobacteria bacterium]|nr:TonB-dependent receptor [Gammaproteobacteria bacterium]
MRRLLTYLILLQPFNLYAEADMLAMLGTEDLFHDEMPIVLSATRLSQPLSESPVAMTVIDRQMIDASGARSIPDLLRLVPGMQVGHFDGNTPVAAYHGHAGEDSKRMQVLIDGRSVYVPSRDAVPWSDVIIDIDDIEKIEVIRGPNASTYGNNSFFGVISIITKHALETSGHYVRVRSGSKNTTDALYEFGGQSGYLDYRVTVSAQNDDGADFIHDDTEADSLSYRLDYQINTHNSLMYKGGFKEATLGDHEPTPDEDPFAAHTIENQSVFQQIKWEHQLKNNNSLTLQYYYNMNKSLEVASLGYFAPASFEVPNSFDFVGTFTVDEPTLAGMLSKPPTYQLTFEDVAILADSLLPDNPGDDPLTPGDYVRFDPFDFIMTLDIKSERHDLEFNHFYQPSDNFRLVWGTSARLDIVTAEGVFQQASEQRHELYRAFSHGEWEFRDDWILNAGYMVEYNEISGNDQAPRLALIHHLDNNNTLRIGFSKATRTPTLFEESGQIVFSQPLTLNNQALPTGHLLSGIDPLTYTRLIADGNLDSETITSYELGYIAKLIDNKLIIDLKLFRDYTKDLTAIEDKASSTLAGDLNTGEIETIINQNETTISGAEISADYHIDKTLRLYGFFA